MSKPTSPLANAKATADAQAALHFNTSMHMLLRAGVSPLVVANLKPNLKFFRQLAGLRGADAKPSKQQRS